VHLFHRLQVVALAAAVALEGAQQQVVLDAHRAEQLALLGHQVHAAHDHPLDLRHLLDAAVEGHLAAGRQQAHDRRQGGRLAGAVGADHGDDLALANGRLTPLTASTLP
jgi:GAF domain-containing protein